MAREVPLDVDRLLLWAAAGEAGAQPVYDAETRQVWFQPTLRRAPVSTKTFITVAAAVAEAEAIRKRLTTPANEPAPDHTPARPLTHRANR